MVMFMLYEHLHEHKNENEHRHGHVYGYGHNVYMETDIDMDKDIWIMRKHVLYKTIRNSKCCDIVIVPDNKSRNIPEVVFVWRWAVGVLGIWRGWGPEPDRVQRGSRDA